MDETGIVAVRRFSRLSSARPGRREEGLLASSLPLPGARVLVVPAGRAASDAALIARERPIDPAHLRRILKGVEARPDPPRARLRRRSGGGNRADRGRPDGLRPRPATAAEWSSATACSTAASTATARGSGRQSRASPPSSSIGTIRGARSAGARRARLGAWARERGAAARARAARTARRRHPGLIRRRGARRWC